MVICNLQCTQYFVIYSNVCIIQPALRGIIVITAALCVLQCFFLGSSSILVIYLVHTKNINIRICLYQFSVNLSVLQSSQSLYHCVIIGIGNILVVTVVCKDCSGQSAVSIIYRLRSLTHISIRILFHIVQDGLCILFAFRNIVICQILSADGNAYIAERRLLSLFICDVNLCLLTDWLTHSLLVSLKLQKCLHLILCDGKCLKSILIIILHELCRCLCNCSLIICSYLNTIVSCFLLHDVHQLNLLQELSGSLLPIGLSRLFIYHLAPDIACASHIHLVHGNGLCLRLTGIQTENTHGNICTIYSGNSLCSIYFIPAAGKHSDSHHASQCCYGRFFDDFLHITHQLPFR